MEVIVNKKNNVAYVNTEEQVIYDVQSALDLLATISYEYGCKAIIVHKSAIVEEFYDLRTRLAGEIVQKYVNYGMKLAIIGDFSGYSSKALQDYIYECNKGRDLFFVPNEEEANRLLTKSLT
jgi:hypothetical protein